MGNIYFLLCLISSLLASASSLEKYLYKVKFLEVPLDHFSYLNNKTFQLKYLVNDSYVDGPNSPVLFYTGNEGDIELFAQNTGFIWENAPNLGALIVFGEHRYYGQSLPFGNKSYDPPNLGYLTAEQALADYAELLYQLTGGKYNRPIIGVGGSYGGMLAAWFRMKYPHIISGALAASAPILQFEDITPCDVFSRILSSVFSVAHTEACKINIKKSWGVFQNYSSTDVGRNVLNAKFNFCVNMTKPDDMKIFFDYLEDVYANLAMANYPYENDFLAPLPAYPVRVFCGQLAKEYDGLDLIEALQKAINIYANYTGKVSCLNYKSAFAPTLGSNGWDFQSCSEMVMPMCSGSQDDMFPTKKWDINKYSDDCFKKFSVRPREHEIVVRYGGRNINSASNIIFSNGLLDPWSGGGVLRSPNNLIDIIIIPEGAHHIDLRAANSKDPSSVRQARRLEIDIIKNWISNYYERA